MKEIFTLEIDGKPYSTNAIYRSARIKGKIVKYLHPDYKIYKKLISVSMSETCSDDKWHQLCTSIDSRAILVRLMVYSSKTLTVKNKISKTFGDCDNFLKATFDGIFEFLNEYNTNLDDSQIMKLEVEKIPADREYFTVEFFTM